jgi:hypothetical protein
LAPATAQVAAGERFVEPSAWRLDAGREAVSTITAIPPRWLTLPQEDVYVVTAATRTVQPAGASEDRRLRHPPVGDHGLIGDLVSPSDIDSAIREATREVS